MKRNFNLLSKTTIVYLIVTFFAFAVTAFFLFMEIDNYLNDEVEERFRYIEHRARIALKKNHHTKKRYSNHITFEELNKLPEVSEYPIYKDTIIINAELEKESFYRVKEVILLEDEKIYKLTMRTGLDEFALLKEAITSVLVPAFIILAVLVVIINFILSGFFLKPFYKILEQMKIYKVGERKHLSEIETTTKEFLKMQSLFIGMVDRIENDYRNLKEYTENMAHEIQTPLSVMRNRVLELMSDESLMEEKSEKIKLLYDEINHLSALGKTLNLLTKIENQEFADTKNIKTKDTLLEVYSSHIELAELKEIEIEINVDENNELNIDPKLFRIMLNNLMRNALSYASNEGPIKIFSDKNIIEFSNYGKELKIDGAKIFERFVSGKGNSNSIGLGLSIVKKICDLNNIEILYKYEENQHKFRIGSNILAN